jgi:phage FluMu gp28-like protein
MTLDSFRQEYEGIPAADGANPFGIDAIRAAISTGIEGPAIVYGIDLASSSDYTVIIGINEQGQACSMERFQGGWEVITKRVRNAVRDTYSLVDSTGVGSPVVQRLQLDGNNIVGFQFTNSSKQSLMTELAAAFQTKDIQIPDDSVLVNELESFGYEYNHSGNVVRYATQPGMHDDCVCALALAWKAYQDNHGPKNSMPRIFAASPIQTRMDRRPGVRTCL